MPPYIRFDLALRVGVERLRIRADIPASQTSLANFLPVIQSLTDAVMAAATREAQRAGRSISCGPRCGACCRQLVPVAEAEALYLRAVVENLGPDHRARIQARHRGAMRKIRHSGMLEPLRSADASTSRDGRRALGLRYFRLGIPCPFLEQESCSIHQHRPLACREYLVTSEPGLCAAPDAGRVETLELPRRPSALLYRFGDGDGSAPARWLPLPLAMQWAESSEAQATRNVFAAPKLFERFLHRLAGTEAQGAVRLAPSGIRSG